MLFIKKIISTLTGRGLIVCPCGHRNITVHGALKHLNSHPSGELEFANDIF